MCERKNITIPKLKNPDNNYANRKKAAQPALQLQSDWLHVTPRLFWIVYQDCFSLYYIAAKDLVASIPVRALI